MICSGAWVLTPSHHAGRRCGFSARDPVALDLRPRHRCGGDPYEQLRVQIGELRERLGGLPSPVEAEGIWRGIWLEEAHHSTAIQPGEWSEGALVSLAEVRHVDHLAMTRVWDIAPHPQATERAGPGSFREHDIERFPGGMQPPPWTAVPALMRDWITDAEQVRAVDQATIAALRVAAIRGRLKAAKAADGAWRSSRAWVDEYRVTRYKRS
jgi:hypothetical protein